MADKKKVIVLFVNPSSGLSGDTQSLVNLIESLKGKILPIVLLTSKADAFKLFDSLGIECLVHPNLTVLSPPLGDEIKNVIRHPWRWRIIKWFRYDLPCLLYVKKALAGRKIDIVHTNTAPTLMGVRIAKMLKVPHVWHIRENIDPNHTYARIVIGRKNLARVIEKADARIFVSNMCLNFWGVNMQNTWVYLDAVRKKTECCYIKEKQPYLLFCSTWISEAKGASKVVSAFGKSGLFAVSSYTKLPIRLKMVGNCNEDYKKKILTLAESHCCAEYIDFVPVQEDVKPYFADAMAFIQPSLNEGLGRTTAEAMFYGCPVIAYASGGTLDLVKDGETGYLFNTVEECAELMRKVCTTDQEEVILRAQEFVKQNLSVENYGEKVMEVYNSVLKTK